MQILLRELIGGLARIPKNLTHLPDGTVVHQCEELLGTESEHEFGSEFWITIRHAVNMANLMKLL